MGGDMMAAVDLAEDEDEGVGGWESCERGSKEASDFVTGSGEAEGEEGAEAAGAQSGEEVGASVGPEGVEAVLTGEEGGVAVAEDMDRRAAHWFIRGRSRRRPGGSGRAHASMVAGVRDGVWFREFGKKSHSMVRPSRARRFRCGGVLVGS